MHSLKRLTMRRAFFVILLLLLPQYVLAAEAFFVNPDQINMTALLAPPPVVGSPVQQAEIQQLLALQNSRTPEQAAFAQADAERSVFRFADVFGPAFTAEKCPKTLVLFTKARKNADAIIDPAKAFWNRPRPYVSSADIHPCVPKPDNASYPSGHSTFASMTAVLLTAMVPEKQTEIFARAGLYRDNRLIGGAHYPSDVAKGAIAGTVIGAFLLHDAAFRSEFEAAKAETRRALGLP